MLRIVLLGIFASLAACTAPQGTKLAMNEGLAPVATGPISKGATIDYSNRGEMISLYRDSTVTVTLPSSNRGGYEWRLAEIPDPTVLQMVSKDFQPSEVPGQPGTETMVFQTVGPGDVTVKMWYGTLWASRMDSAQRYGFTANVTAEEPKPEPKKSSQHSRKR